MGQQKTLSAGTERVREDFRLRRLYANYVRCLETLGAFQQIELHRFAFIERAVSILLDRGEMDEHVLASGALDKSISFRPVEPLYCSLLSHRYSFRLIAKNSSMPALLNSWVGDPLKSRSRTRSRLPRTRKSWPKRKATNSRPWGRIGREPDGSITQTQFPTPCTETSTQVMLRLTACVQQ